MHKCGGDGSYSSPRGPAGPGDSGQGGHSLLVKLWGSDLPSRSSAPRIVCHRLPSMRMWDVVRYTVFVPEIRIQWSLSKKHTLGTLNFCQSVPQPAPPTSSPLSEMAWVKVRRVTYVEESTSGAPVREKMADAPV
jgi:hypothetical protein